MINSKYWEEEFFECKCASGWYCSMLRITRDTEDNEISLATLMSPGNFWHRFKQVWGFLFGTRGNLHFDQFLFENEDMDKLVALLQKQQKLRKKDESLQN